MTLNPIVDHCLRGWAWHPSRAYERVLVDIDIDGQPYRQVLAEVFRPHLIPAGAGDGRRGFEIDLPQAIFDRKPTSSPPEGTRTASRLQASRSMPTASALGALPPALRIVSRFIYPMVSMRRGSAGGHSSGPRMVR